MVKRKGGVHERTVTKNDIDEALAAGEAAFPVSGSAVGGSMRGGGCSPEVKQRVRILLATAIGTGIYLKGGEAVTAIGKKAGETVGTIVVAGFQKMSNFECSIGASKSAINNLLCTKYAELLEGANAAARAIQTSGGLQTVSSALLGASVVTMFTSVKDAVVYVAGLAKDTATMSGQAFETMVDEICKALPDTPNLEAEAAAALARMSGSTGGRRRSRSRKMRQSRRRPARRSTMRRIRMPLYAPVSMMRPRTF